jgi:poly-gamma-glutamate synthesis protein (capsule biosynthesis protein)
MKIAIGGDISITKRSWELFDKADEKGAFDDVISVFERNERVMVNLECAVTESENRIAKFGPNLKAPLNTVKTLKKAGVTDCFLSNNHIFDFGIPGLNDTLHALDEEEMLWNGIGDNYEDSRKNHYVIKDGCKIAFINVCEHEYSYATANRVGARPFDEFETMHDIRMAKKESDRVVVIYHGGKEYCRYPSPRLLKACREMVRCGADVVLCQHSHCIGCYEYFEGGHILYGQGNFHFNSYMDIECWHEGLLVELDIDKHRNEITFIPVVEKDDGGITLAKGERNEDILSGFAKRSKQLLDGTWREEWHKFAKTVEGAYRKSIANIPEDADEKGHQLFSHYLDCEAHTDIWRELFPTYNLTNET